MKRLIYVLCVVILIVLGPATSSWACSCLHRAACGSRRYHDADFVAEVLSRQVTSWDDKLGPYSVLYRVRVTDTFRGTQKAGEVVSVRTGFGGGDCGYKFQVGAKYLIDASKNGNTFLTGNCFLTAPVEESEVELRTLRKVALGQHVPSLTGVLMRGTETDDGETFAPIAGVPVQAMRIGGRGVSKTVTDAVGSFTFPSLSEGKYDLILGLPANLSASYTDPGPLNQKHVPSIEVGSDATDTAACHIRIVVEPAGTISGVVQSKGGTPLDGWVNADTVTRDDKPWNTVRTAVVGPGGTFSLEHLKPGRYSVQFTSRAGFVKGQPQIIELRDGEVRNGVVLLSQ